MSEARKDAQGNSANTPVPLWILAPHEEKQVLADCQEQANNQCARQFWEMGECTSKHQLLFSWYCADQKKKLLACVEHWGSKEKYAQLREAYIENKRKELAKEGRI